MNNETIKVVLADDHPFARSGVKSLIDKPDSIEVVAEASSGMEALELVKEKKPDVLISDISMPTLSGLELAEIISKEYPRTKVLILSVHQDQEYILKGYEAGAMGYLPKNSSEDELVEAIHTIHSGQKHINQMVSQILAQSLITEQSIPHQDFNLTKRESEVLRMLIDGMSNKQIAADLFISIRTVDTHRTNIMKKLNVNNAAEMVRVGLNENLYV